uniref:Uncharacterized protein n=1 Tax=Arundo donax TaxID=35708 RepID=A0A0A9HJ06_ARUDO
MRSLTKWQLQKRVVTASKQWYFIATKVTTYHPAPYFNWITNALFLGETNSVLASRNSCIFLATLF